MASAARPKKGPAALDLATWAFSAKQHPSLSIAHPVLIAILSKLTVDASDSAILKRLRSPFLWQSREDRN